MAKKILSILSILFGVGMIVFGANKIVPFMPAPKLTEQQALIFGAFSTVKWLLPLVGIIEVIGGALMLYPKTRALGAIVILPVIVGILLHHLTHDPAGIVPGAVFAFIDFWIIASNKERYMHLLG